MKDNDNSSKGVHSKLSNRQDAITRLPEAIAALKREAHANGLTDADIDAELEAWRSQVNPSKNP